MNKTILTTAIVAGLISGYTAKLKAEDKKPEAAATSEKMKCNCEKMKCKTKKNKHGKKEMACAENCEKKADAAAKPEATAAPEATPEHK